MNCWDSWARVRQLGCDGKAELRWDSWLGWETWAILPEAISIRSNHGKIQPSFLLSSLKSLVVSTVINTRVITDNQVTRDFRFVDICEREEDNI